MEKGPGFNVELCAACMGSDGVAHALLRQWVWDVQQFWLATLRTDGWAVKTLDTQRTTSSWTVQLATGFGATFLGWTDEPERGVHTTYVARAADDAPGPGVEVASGVLCALAVLPQGRACVLWRSGRTHELHDEYFLSVVEGSVVGDPMRVTFPAAPRGVCMAGGEQGDLHLLWQSGETFRGNAIYYGLVPAGCLIQNGN
jgi:hypothetical protein